MKIVAFILTVWALAVATHLFWEVWIIAARGIDALPECHRFWCPHGILNRWKK